MGSTDAPLPDTLYFQWDMDTNSELWASPVVKDKKVYQIAGKTKLRLSLKFCTRKNISDSISVISSIAVPTPEPFYEPHSEIGKGVIIIFLSHGVLIVSMHCEKRRYS
jgi:hypothetical protein